MPNQPISKAKREQIQRLSKQNMSLNGIAKKTNTSVPTVRKYSKQNRN